jgi:hypothetical protein
VLDWLSKAAVVLALGAVLVLRLALDHRTEPHAVRDGLLLLLLAGGMAVCHYFMVDSQPLPAAWQKELYLGLLGHTFDSAPHRYRPLPYGFVRLLERITGDWPFSCMAYRTFFSFWFVWAWLRFARLFLPPRPALLTLLVLLPLYPLSIARYQGQLTDPLSHFLFALGLICVVQDRRGPLALALALGVLAKETAVLLVPVYLAYHRRGRGRALLTTAWLGMVGVAAFLAARLPLGWRPGYGDLNGTTGLMVGTNLGIGPPLALTTVPLVENYLHIAAFFGAFVPVLAWRWRRIDPRLRVLCLTAPPLVLASNVCFGWLYESRNYVPLLPLLTTATVAALTASGEKSFPTT